MYPGKTDTDEHCIDLTFKVEQSREFVISVNSCWNNMVTFTYFEKNSYIQNKKQLRAPSCKIYRTSD